MVRGGCPSKVSEARTKGLPCCFGRGPKGSGLASTSS